MTDPRTVTPRWRRLVSATIVTVAVLVGLGTIAIALVLGRCDAFGGRCPAAAPSVLDDDVLVTAGIGASILVAVPMLALRPTRRRLVSAIAAGMAAFVVMGLIARASVYG